MVSANRCNCLQFSLGGGRTHVVMMLSMVGRKAEQRVNKLCKEIPSRKTTQRLHSDYTETTHRLHTDYTEITQTTQRLHRDYTETTQRLHRDYTETTHRLLRHTHTHTYTYIYICTGTRTHTCIRANLHTHIQLCGRSHTCIHACIHTCAFRGRGERAARLAGGCNKKPGLFV